MLAQQIKDNMAELSPAERKIARAMLADYPGAGLGSVQMLADRAGVSLPSVVRFARRMGYGGFVDFQQALRDEISEQAKGPLQRLDNWVTTESASSLIEAAITSSTLAIQCSLRDIAEYEIAEATRLIGAKEHHIILGGGRISQSLAMYFGRNLQQVLKCSPKTITIVFSRSSTLIKMTYSCCSIFVVTSRICINWHRRLWHAVPHS